MKNTNSDKFGRFAETISCFISRESNSILRLFRHMLKDLTDPGEALPDEFSVEIIKEHLFKSVVKDMVDKPESEEVQMNPESVMVELIRQGIPKEHIFASFKHLTATLTNASYRFYRRTDGYPSGTIRIKRYGSYVIIRSTLPPKEIARLIILLDHHLPEIDDAAGKLFEKLQQLFRKKQTENMALEISRRVIETQIADVLPGLGITAKYDISDGKIRLNLTRTYSAEVELPLEELQDFLSNPKLVESALKLEPVSPTPEKNTVFPHRFTPKHFHSNITATTGQKSRQPW